MSASTTQHLTNADIEKLSSFRSSLREYLTNSHLFCELFDLTDLQYLLLLNVKTLEADTQASCSTLKEKLHLTNSALTMLINRCLKADLLEISSGSPTSAPRTFKLSAAGNEVIATLASIHKKEFDNFQMLFKADCRSRCTSPICWKGSD